MQIKSTLALLLLLALAAGCNHMTYTTLPGDLVSEKSVTYREVGTFEVEVGEMYLLGGLAKISEEKVARTVLEKVREMGGNGVRDLHYKVNITFLDFCCSFFGSIVTLQTQTITVTGTVVQITGERADTMLLRDLEVAAAGQQQLNIPVKHN